MEDKKPLPDPSEMTEKERQERIKELLTELKHFGHSHAPIITKVLKMPCSLMLDHGMRAG